MNLKYNRMPFWMITIVRKLKMRILFRTSAPKYMKLIRSLEYDEFRKDFGNLMLFELDLYRVIAAAEPNNQQ